MFRSLLYSSSWHTLWTFALRVNSKSPTLGAARLNGVTALSAIEDKRTATRLLQTRVGWGDNNVLQGVQMNVQR